MTKKSLMITASSVVGVAALTVGGFAATSFLSGGGAQPEDVLPANTLAFVKVDMDPAAGQKVNLYKLSKKFEDVEVSSEDSIKDDLLEPLFADSLDGIDYDKDIKPWLGDRAALAAIPDGQDSVTPVMVVEFTDEEKMQAGLEKVEASAASDLETDPPSAEEIDDVAWAVSGDYVVIAEDQKIADEVAGTEQVLAADADYQGDIEALGGDQIVTAWADVEATYDAMPEDVTADLLDLYDVDTDAADPIKFEPTGSLVMGINAQSDHIEFVTKALDLSTGIEQPASVPGTGLVNEFPADTVAAVSVSGLGEAAVSLYDSLAESGAVTDEMLAEAEGRLDLDLPDDLRAILGTDLAAGATMSPGDPEDLTVFGKVRTADAARVLSLIETLVGETGAAADDVYAEARADHYVAGSSADALALAEAGGLGGNERFRKVVADASTASAVGFVDIGRLFDELVTAEEDPDRGFAPLDAFGFSVSGDAESSTFTARLSLR
ncbi:DUF3352 domain-containing protein [Nocardioides jishulii]|nr:DUF3352 domain-containing protein [Nocardioides jishulii]